MNLLGDSLDYLKDYIDLASKCPFAYLGSIGDGFCHAEFYIDECDFDGGDCSQGKVWVRKNCTCSKIGHCTVVQNAWF